jgi:hypothetical protein
MYECVEKIARKPVVMFCENCGSFQVRQKDGTLRCKNGHVLSDEMTNIIQKNEAVRKQRRIEEAKEYSDTFPDPDLDDVVIFHIINPYKQKRKNSKGILPGNAECFPVYEEIKEMRKEYPPTKFKHHSGNIFANTKWQLKGGYIICTKDIAMVVKKRIESFKLPEGHFVLEPINDKTAVREMIEILKKESKQMIL